MGMAEMTRRRKYWILMTTLVLACVHISWETADEEESEVDDEIIENADSEEFIATNEWKEIVEGQTIPRGLHVRINLQTGKKEAKLLDASDEKHTNYNTEISIGNSNDQPLIEDRSGDKFQTLKKVKDEFRTIHNLRKEKIFMKADVEIISELLAIFQMQNATENNKLECLSELEYYLHQIDNAQDFVKLGGLTVVLQAINSTNEKFRSSAALLLGAALQSNPNVQIAVLEHGLMQHLLHVIAIDTSVEAKSRSLFALSCLLRNFPVAQQHFIESGGISVLGKQFHDTEFHSQKLQMKSVVIVRDLLQEKMDAMNRKNKFGNQDKIEQYSRVNIEDSVVEHGWCHRFARLLQIPDNDAREKVIEAMKTLVNICHTQFQQQLSVIQKLLQEYATLAEEEASNSNDSEHYFASIEQNIRKIIWHISKSEL